MCELEDDIYYKIGKYKFNHLAKCFHYRIPGLVEKFNIDKNDPKPGILRFIKATIPPMLPDDEEIIHRKDWDLDSLNGETELQLLHPDYWTLVKFIQQHHTRKHDVLTIFECSNAKPYSSGTVLRSWMRRYGAFSDFACISNPGIIPMEYSQYYPYRYDEWDHSAEHDDIAEKYIVVNQQRFITYVKLMGYKKVIVVMQNRHAQQALYLYHKDHYEECKDWLYILNNDEFKEEYTKKFMPIFKNPGFLISRMMGLPYVKERYNEILRSCLSDDDAVLFDEVLSIIKTKNKNKLNKWNKQHGVELPDYTKGIKNTNFERYTSTTLVDKERVREYRQWVEQQLKQLKYDPSNPSFYDNNVYKTALDWLIEYKKDKGNYDPDEEYWNMRAALDEIDSLVRFADYCYYYKPFVEEYHIDVNQLIEEANNSFLIQLSLKQQNVRF